MRQRQQRLQLLPVRQALVDPPPRFRPGSCSPPVHSSVVLWMRVLAPLLAKRIQPVSLIHTERLSAENV